MTQYGYDFSMALYAKLKRLSVYCIGSFVFRR